MSQCTPSTCGRVVANSANVSFTWWACRSCGRVVHTVHLLFKRWACRSCVKLVYTVHLSSMRWSCGSYGEHVVHMVNLSFIWYNCRSFGELVVHVVTLFIRRTCRRGGSMHMNAGSLQYSAFQPSRTFERYGFGSYFARCKIRPRFSESTTHPIFLVKHHRSLPGETSKASCAVVWRFVSCALTDSGTKSQGWNITRKIWRYTAKKKKMMLGTV